MYTDDEVQAALEPLRNIPAFTELLTVDPPAPLKRKHQEKEEGSKSQPQPELKAEPDQELGGAVVLPRPEEQSEEKKEIAEGDQGAADSKSGMADSSSAKPKVPSKNPKSVKSAVGKSNILGKPPQPCPKASVASLLTMFMGCDTADEFSSLLEYLQLNGGWFPFQVQHHGACQFAAFRRGIDCPQEYINMHLRRQLVMDVVHHKEFFLSHIKGHIAGVVFGKTLPFTGAQILSLQISKSEGGAKKNGYYHSLP